MKLIFMVMAALCLTLNCAAQNIAPLQIGDSLPDYTFKKIMNAPFSSVPYAKIKNKVVVLDFFATWCSSCIHLLPHLDSLKAEFGDHLDIFIVTREPGEKVQKLLQTNKKASEIKLPFVVEDSVLYKWFPHKYLPHEIIIKGGVVKAITYAEFLNSNSIKTIIRRDSLELPLKQDWIDYDYGESLLKNLKANSVEGSFGEFYLSGSIRGVPEMAYTNKSENGLYIRYTKVNHSLVKLFERAAGFLNENNRIILNVKDTSKLITINPLNYKWSEKNRYCLEYQVPLAWSQDKVEDWLLNQFTNFTNYSLSVENRLVDCWILKKGVNDPVTEYKVQRFDTEYTFKNVEDMVQAMNNQLFGSPIVPIVLNGTGNNAAIHISLNKSDIHNPYLLQKELKKYGFDLIPTKQLVRMLVIRDKERGK